MSTPEKKEGDIVVPADMDTMPKSQKGTAGSDASEEMKSKFDASYVEEVLNDVDLLRVGTKEVMASFYSPSTDYTIYAFFINTAHPSEGERFTLRMPPFGPWSVVNDNGTMSLSDDFIRNSNSHDELFNVVMKRIFDLLAELNDGVLGERWEGNRRNI